MKKLNLIIVVLLAFSLISPPNLMAEVVGTVTCIEGRVDKRAIGTSDYLPVVAGDGISIGDALRTKSYSKAAVSFKDDSVLHIGDASQVEIKEYVVGEDRCRKTAEIDLDRGKVRAIVAKTPDLAPFNINTPNAMGTVKGSDIFVSFQQSATNVLVSEGTFNMVNTDFPDQFVAVEKGMTTQVPYNAPPKDPRVFLPDEKTKFEEITGSVIQDIEGVDPNAEFTKAVVADVSGVVRVEPRGTKRMHAPVKSEVLNTGDKIETGKNGNIKLSFDNGLKIGLKPNTQLIITRLTRNPKTGDYTNEFESGHGKLVAQLQNMPSGSSFKVKTPNACCGIRGTIMYLEILPNMTKTFFEGGSGFIDDLINGTSTVIKEGITFSVDDQGNTSEKGTTDEDRSGFGSQFGSDGGDVYGYTGDAPETGGDTTGGGDVPGGDTGSLGLDPGEDNTPFDDVKVEVPVDKTTPVPTVGITVNIEGKMGSFRDGSFTEDGDSSFSGTITAETTSPVWSGQTGSGIGLTGELSSPEERNFFRGELNGQGDDGGQFKGGFFSGTGHGETGDGVLSAIYIDGSGMAGTMFGHFSGIDYVEDISNDRAGTFSASGELSFIPMVYIGDADSAQIETFEDSSYAERISLPENEQQINLDVGVNSESMNIEGQNWGVGRLMISGTYDRPMPEGAGKLEWTQFTGSHIFPSEENERYVFYTIEGEDNLENFLSMDIIRTHIDYYAIEADLATIVGVYEVGDYSGDRGYQGTGTVVYQYEPLAFVSSVDGENFLDQSIVNGLFGSSDSLWDDSIKNVLFRGDYSAGTKISGSTYIWGAEKMKSENYLTNDNSKFNTTYKGGAYSGGIIGYIKDSYAASLFRAIYVSPENEVGYLAAKLTGETYQGDINMFEMSGNIDVHQMTYYADEITPEMLNDEGVILTSEIVGYGENDYMSGGIVDSGKAFNLNDAGWGIWGAPFQGEYHSDGVSAWKMPFAGGITDEDADYKAGIFLGILKGDKWVQNGPGEAGFDGMWFAQNNRDDDVTTVSFGTMSGDIVMDNTGEWVTVEDEFQSDWSGVCAGEWVEVEDLLDLADIAGEVAGLMSDLNDITDSVASDNLIFSAADQNSFIQSANMNIALYSLEDMNLWAGLINGTYNTAVEEPGEWGVNLEGVNSNSIDLDGTNWADHVWSADVSGVIDGNDIEGTAVGTYDDVGNFAGAGAGTWNES